jgi:hypothetical protein
MVTSKYVRDALCVPALLLCLLAPPALAQGKVCGDPAMPCPGFKMHDLSFPIRDDGKPRPDHRSAPFYAVLLRTAERCSIKEAERDEVQQFFPRNKVFHTRFECEDDLENNVTYTNVDEKLAFLAVYAGEERGAAERLLAEIRASGRFPGANLRRMQVVRVSP